MRLTFLPREDLVDRRKESLCVEVFLDECLGAGCERSVTCLGGYARADDDDRDALKLREVLQTFNDGKAVASR